MRPNSWVPVSLSNATFCGTACCPTRCGIAPPGCTAPVSGHSAGCPVSTRGRRADTETEWSLRMEIRARVGSAALVLDGPGGERVLRAGLEGLSATMRVYPKTLAVRPGAPPRVPGACAQTVGGTACVLVER